VLYFRGMGKQQLMVTKSSGQVVPYDEKRVIRSMKRSGVDQKTIQSILQTIKPKIKDKIHTSILRKMVRDELKARASWAAARYDLREALIKLGPAGYNFEKYIASILKAYGYKTDTPYEYQGACIKHEVDVIAEKDGRGAFIEAKFRHDFRATINIKDTMSTWTRFLDLVDGSKLDLCPHFDEVWIVTNARFTDQSLKFGNCKNMKLIGWNYPKERTLAQMVDLDALYPITIIEDVTKKEMEQFAKADLMLCQEILKFSPEKLSHLVGITTKRSEKILRESKLIVEGPNA
jgi:hypothetical protein